MKNSMSAGDGMACLAIIGALCFVKWLERKDNPSGAESSASPEGSNDVADAHIPALDTEPASGSIYD